MSDTVDVTEDADESTCDNPCDPDHSCDGCEPYWQRMQAEGFWDRRKHRWTDKGWTQITRSY